MVTNQMVKIRKVLKQMLFSQIVLKGEEKSFHAKKNDQNLLNVCHVFSLLKV